MTSTTTRVIRADLPTPDAVLLDTDHGPVLVADHRMPDDALATAAGWAQRRTEQEE